jgi:neutral ceramidase
VDGHLTRSRGRDGIDLEGRHRVDGEHAKALALEDVHQGDRLVLLTMDLIAVPGDIAAEVADEARRRWGLPREGLLIVASHTHSGPEIRPDKVPFFRIPPTFAEAIRPYVHGLVTRLVEVIGAAIDEIRPARLIVRQTSAPFAHNRRGAGAVDRDVPVLELIGEDGHRRAVVVGYACHNTAMPPADGRYCGDYAGFAQATLEEGGQADVAMFVPGAGADQDPEPRGSIDLARRHGRTLAEAVRGCLEAQGGGVEIAGPLRVAFEEVPLDFLPIPSRAALRADAASDDLPRRTKAGYLLERLDRGETFAATYPCPLHVARLGDAFLLVAIGGEPVIDYAHQLKRRYAVPGRVVWVAGYANDMFGYVPTARVLREGGYEGSRSVLWSALPAPFTEDTEPRIRDAFDRLVDRLDFSPGASAGPGP